MTFTGELLYVRGYPDVLWQQLCVPVSTTGRQSFQLCCISQSVFWFWQGISCMFPSRELLGYVFGTVSMTCSNQIACSSMCSILASDILYRRRTPLKVRNHGPACWKSLISAHVFLYPRYESQPVMPLRLLSYGQLPSPKLSKNLFVNRNTLIM